MSSLTVRNADGSGDTSTGRMKSVSLGKSGNTITLTRNWYDEDRE